MSVDPDRLYVAAEVADILRCGKTHVYALLDEEAIARVRIGSGRKGIRVMGSAILAFLESRTEGGPSPRGALKYLRPRP